MDPLADALFGEDKKWAKIPVNFIIVLISIGSAIYFCKQEDYGSATAVAFLGMALRSGYRAGAATYIGFLVGGALAMVAAVPLGKLLEPAFQQLFGTHGITNRFLSVGTVGSMMTIIVTVSLRNLIRRQFRNRPWLKSTDRWLGLACGGIQGSLLFLILAGGAIIVEPIAREVLNSRGPQVSQRIAQRVVMVAEATRSGAIGPYVDAWNPFEHIGALRSLLHGVAVLQNPDSVYSVANHPALEEFFERPEFQRTLSQLSADPRLNDVVSSGNRITCETLASLLESPAILSMLDDREFRRTLAEVLGEVNSEILLSQNSDW